MPQLARWPDGHRAFFAFGRYGEAPDRTGHVEYPVHGDDKSYWLRALPDWIEQDDVPKVNGDIVS